METLQREHIQAAQLLLQAELGSAALGSPFERLFQARFEELVGGDAAAGTPGPVSAALPPEAQRLLQYLRAAGWSVNAVAHQLGVARMTVYRRMQRWGIRQPDRSPADPRK